MQLASQIGNVAFRALARTLARQPDEDTIVFLPDHIYPGGAGQGPTIGPDGTLEFPPDYIGPDSSRAGAAAGAAGGSVG